jgi:formylglycine-generating enzyme required for sulfatase activity
MGERERCESDAWVAEPCPLDEPACEAGNCVLRGPQMVGVGAFYVDSTEVTVAQYREFLTARGDDFSGQPGVCAWNDSYYDPARAFNPDDWPITYVDWCDAAAYCAWAGKRLCGSVGGGPIAADDFLEPAMSQWYLACGGPEGGSHPNGDPECNSSGDTQPIAPVGSFAGCEGFYPGLFDLEGNVAEWVDACDGMAGAEDTCYLAGGSIIDNTSFCTNTLADYPRNGTARPFGFRCCSG